MFHVKRLLRPGVSVVLLAGCSGCACGCGPQRSWPQVRVPLSAVWGRAIIRSAEEWTSRARLRVGRFDPLWAGPAMGEGLFHVKHRYSRRHLRSPAGPGGPSGPDRRGFGVGMEPHGLLPCRCPDHLVSAGASVRRVSPLDANPRKSFMGFPSRLRAPCRMFHVKLSPIGRNFGATTPHRVGIRAKAAQGVLRCGADCRRRGHSEGRLPRCVPS